MNEPADDYNDPIVYSEQAKAQMDADPELAEAMREMAAIFRQAHAGVKTGQYASFEDGVEALTGHRPEQVDADADDC